MVKQPEILSKTRSEDQQHKILLNTRPFGGVYVRGESRPEKVDTNSIDVIIVLLRALRAYGWVCVPRTKEEEALCRIVDMNIGWSEAEDLQVKSELLKVLRPALTADSVKSLDFTILQDVNLSSIIMENDMFKLVDEKAIGCAFKGAPLKWIPVLGPYSVKGELMWDGRRSLQSHMNWFFSVRPIMFRGQPGTDTVQMLGKMPEFICLPYNPDRARSFKELAKFDLNTMTRYTEAGKEVLTRQNTRYHILAIVKLSDDGREDIRVYNRLNRVIEEWKGGNWESKAKSRRKIPHWTVEEDNDAHFVLFYYAFAEMQDDQTSRHNLPYDPVEFHERNDPVVEGMKGVKERDPRRGLDAGDLMGEKKASKSDQSGGQPPQEDPRDRWRDQLEVYQNVDRRKSRRFPKYPGELAASTAMQHPHAGRGQRGGHGAGVEKGHQHAERQSLDAARPGVGGIREREEPAKVDPVQPKGLPTLGQVGSISIFRKLPEPDEDETDEDEDEKAAATRRKEQRKVETTRVYGEVSKHWPIAAGVAWEHCLGRVKAVGLISLCDWCRDSCVGDGPFPKGDNEEANIQKAMGSLRKYVFPDPNGKPAWDMKTCQQLMSEVNTWTRCLQLSGRVSFKFNGKEYNLR